MNIWTLPWTTVLAASDDLRRRPWKEHPCIYAGHCYVASEAAWHAAGGMASRWRPRFIRHEGAPHWWLAHVDTGEVFDVTADQFNRVPDYAAGRPIGFLTREPSSRARILMQRLGVAQAVACTGSACIIKPDQTTEYSNEAVS